jgi:predicted nucleic acid-binding protein
MFLLDTCVLSEGVRQTPDADVDRWFRAQDTDVLFVSAMTAGELRYGIDRLPVGRKRDGLERWFSETILIGFAGRVLAFDLVAASHWAALRAVHPNASVVDSQIAATAIAHGFTLVTRNVKDFAFAGLSVFNPWSE